MEKLKKQVSVIEGELSLFKERQRQNYDELTLVESSTMGTLL